MFMHQAAMLRRLTDLTTLRATFAPCRHPGEDTGQSLQLLEGVQVQDNTGVLLAARLLSADATILTRHGQAHARGPAESDEDWQDSEDPAGALLGAQLRPIPMSDELEVRSHTVALGNAVVGTACWKAKRAELAAVSTEPLNPRGWSVLLHDRFQSMVVVARLGREAPPRNLVMPL